MKTIKYRCINICLITRFQNHNCNHGHRVFLKKEIELFFSFKIERPFQNIFISEFAVFYL